MSTLLSKLSLNNKPHANRGALPFLLSIMVEEVDAERSKQFMADPRTEAWVRSAPRAIQSAYIRLVSVRSYLSRPETLGRLSGGIGRTGLNIGGRLAFSAPLIDCSKDKNPAEALQAQLRAQLRQFAAGVRFTADCVILAAEQPSDEVLEAVKALKVALAGHIAPGQSTPNFGPLFANHPVARDFADALVTVSEYFTRVGDVVPRMHPATKAAMTEDITATRPVDSKVEQQLAAAGA